MKETKKLNFQPNNEASLTTSEQETLRSEFSKYLETLQIPGLEKVEGTILIIQGDSADHRHVVTNVVLNFSCQMQGLGQITSISEARLGHSYFVIDRAKRKQLLYGLHSVPECIAMYRAAHNFFAKHQIQLKDIPMTDLILEPSTSDEPNPELVRQISKKVIGFTVSMKGVPHK